jgi:hypothetical protein
MANDTANKNHVELPKFAYILLNYDNKKKMLEVFSCFQTCNLTIPILSAMLDVLLSDLVDKLFKGCIYIYIYIYI